MKKFNNNRAEKTSDGPMGNTIFWLTVAEITILGLGFLGWVLDWY